MLDFINTHLFGPGLCAAVFLSGVYLLLRLRPFRLTTPPRLFHALRGKAEEASPLRTMLVALAGTLGVGNIAGVTSAIAIGGPGAIFWMWISSIAALPIKYAEIVLAVKYRRRDSRGKFHGGAYFYIEEHGGRTARLFAGLFALLCLGASLAMGCAVQANAIAVSLHHTLRVNPTVCGILLAILTLAVTSGGLSRISGMTFRLIPLMSGIYIIMSGFILFTNLPLLGEITAKIVSCAFTPEAAGGGILGFLTGRTVRLGVIRGIVSNEAGCGTAPIAHASAEVKSPAAQGIWGMVEVFIDTPIICSLTAYTVLIAEQHGIAPDSDGMRSAVEAFGHFIPCANLLLCAAVIVFAFCTIACWFHYGNESLSYLTTKQNVRRLYTLLYAVCAFFGCVMSDGIVWGLSDLFISAMTALNIIAILLRTNEVKHETDNYCAEAACNFVNKAIP